MILEAYMPSFGSVELTKLRVHRGGNRQWGSLKGGVSDTGVDHATTSGLERR